MGPWIMEMLRRLQHEKERQGFSLQQLGTISGVHRTAIGLIEKGQRSPSMINCIRLADALGLQLHEVLMDAIRRPERAGTRSHPVPSAEKLAHLQLNLEFGLIDVAELISLLTGVAGAREKQDRTRRYADRGAKAISRSEQTTRRPRQHFVHHTHARRATHRWAVLADISSCDCQCR